MTTYFLKMKGDNSSQEGSSELEAVVTVAADDEIPKTDARLIEWNAGLLKRLLQQVVAWRLTHGRPGTGFLKLSDELSRNESPIEEVQEVIAFTEPEIKPNVDLKDPTAVELGEAVEAQLHLFVSSIFRTYKKNPFHNFEHASHVAMTVSKMLSRIIGPYDTAFGHRSTGIIASGLVSDSFISSRHFSR